MSISATIKLGTPLKYRVITAILLLGLSVAPSSAQDLYPKHIDARTQQAIKRGLEYLAKNQTPDGNWSGQDAAMYPTTTASLAGMAFLCGGNTPSRGQYSDNVKRAEMCVIGMGKSNGLITDPAEAGGRPMHGHGFAMLYLASVYGMETEPRARESLKRVINSAIRLTAGSQSPLGGWIYMPSGTGDEGSVTVTQMQGLRAASNAGFLVPKSTIANAVKYLEICRTPENGIKYSAASAPQTRLPISAAAVATLYNAGEYDSKLANGCLEYVWAQFRNRPQWSKGGGHDFYAHLYAAQAFYQAGDKYWDAYFPQARDQLLAMQLPDGSWNGDGIGPIYGTSIALIILQLPYKLVPIFQR